MKFKSKLKCYNEVESSICVKPVCMFVAVNQTKYLDSASVSLLVLLSHDDEADDDGDDDEQEDAGNDGGDVHHALAVPLGRLAFL